MKFLKISDKIIIMDGRDPLQYVDLATKKLYKYPASKFAYFDESSDWPIFRWWRNPIKWYQWNKILKVAGRNSKMILQTTPKEEDHDNIRTH